MTSMVLLVRMAASSLPCRRSYAEITCKHRHFAPDFPASKIQATSADAPSMLRPTGVWRTVRLPIADGRALGFRVRDPGEPDLLVTVCGRDLRLAVRLGQPDDLVEGDLNRFGVAD